MGDLSERALRSSYTRVMGLFIARVTTWAVTPKLHGKNMCILSEWVIYLEALNKYLLARTKGQRRRRHIDFISY